MNEQLQIPLDQSETDSPACFLGAVSGSVLQNRSLFLSELRSGKYRKGTIKSDERGLPVFETESDKNGHCCCAVMVELFGGKNYSVSKAAKAVGISSKQCAYIQKEINDNDSTLAENADRIELEVFKHYH